MNYLNSKGGTEPPPQFLMRQLLKMFPGALPSQIEKEDWNTLQDLLIVESTINYFHNQMARLRPRGKR